MNKILCFFFMLQLTGCKNPLGKKHTAPEVVANTTRDTAHLTGKPSQIHLNTTQVATPSPTNAVDTLTKDSRPFSINGLKCYWKHTLIVSGTYTGGMGTIELKNYKTGRTLFTVEDYYTLDNYHRSDGPDFKNRNKIMDVNFDTYSDFVFYDSTSSGSSGEFFNVYLFDKTKKKFTLSKDLSGYGLEIDTLTRTVSHYYKYGYAFNLHKIWHYVSNGGVKFREATTRKVFGSSNDSLETTYIKIVGRKIILNSIDTTAFEGW